jgi:hypothetical protein
MGKCWSYVIHSNLIAAQQAFEFFHAEKLQKQKRNNMVNDMRKEYDFSKGERGKFFNNDVKLNLPVYLDDEILSFVQGIAKKRKTDVSSIVNQILRSDMHLAEVFK